MKIKPILLNLIILTHSLLAVLLIFENFVSIPVFLQPFGRMHPMILHFPITLVVLLAILEIGKKSLPGVYEKLMPSLATYTVLLTSITALSGFFLYSEGGYTGYSLSWHKWGATLLSFLLFISLYLRSGISRISIYSLSFLLILITGHLGANLTHGEDFLWEPIMVKEANYIDENGDLFHEAILPIIEKKCTACHNPTKKKGELALNTWKNLKAGGENGEVIVSGIPAESSIYSRLLLDIDHDDHMPPKGKPQLTENEIFVFRKWIEMGGNDTISISKIDQNDSLWQALTEIYKPKEEQEYGFPYADPDVLKGLSTPFRTVRQPVYNSPAVEVSIYVGSQWEENNIQELFPIKEQVVSLYLASLPVNDSDLTDISEFQNLENLNLNFTNITEEGLKSLGSLPKLQKMSLDGVPLSEDFLEIIATWPQLRYIYLWKTDLLEETLVQMSESFPELVIETGYKGSEGDSLKLSPPLLVNSETVLGRDDLIEIEHKIGGVRLFYTTDGSIPDSTSHLYKGPLKAINVGQLKVKAYKEGWLPSDPVEFGFYIKGYTPKKITLLSPPNERYRGAGAAGLTDNVKGDIENFVSPAWLGYQEKPFSALVDFGNDIPELHAITLSYGLNIGAYIMKPVKLEIYGGNISSEMSLIYKKEYKLPEKFEPNGEFGIMVNLKDSQYKYYKVVAYPVEKLPDWHNGAGDQGWVFVDELFFH